MVITRKALLAIFIALTVGLAVVSAAEYYEVNNLRNSEAESSAIERVYEVAFVQAPACGIQGDWDVPWAVTLDNKTEIQPANATLPITTQENTSNQSLTMISFSVGNGTYGYEVVPKEYGPSPGVVTVNGSNVLVRLVWEVTGGCQYPGLSG